MHTGFWRGNLREGDLFKYPGIDGKIILKWILEKRDGGEAWAESIWLRTGDGLL
jgi:hypothetical protein